MTWIFVITAIVLLVTYASCKPADKKDSCQRSCASDYTPLCGKPAEGKGTEITFGNKCVLDNYNCEKKDKRMFKDNLNL